ncbi:hypothetical protein D0Y65_023898 [Glycine soja]|uniref:DUF8039 domain-containing protein n=1 Tax=Glycine soja TaxID=3848 RepID=A0A445J009_GLYSO|nr:hypothetical protein D0Y65_023898 [Glycine soja]
MLDENTADFSFNWLTLLGFTLPPHKASHLAFSSRIPNGSGSCNITSNNIAEGVSPCKLYVSSSLLLLIARGKVYIQIDTLHNRSLPHGNVKVSVDVVVESNAQLQIPNHDDKIMAIAQAIGTFVAWPINLIQVDDMCPKQPNSNDYGYNVCRCIDEIINYYQGTIPEAKQQGGDKKAGSQGKKKKACITWEENAFNTSSESSNEEEANLCLMVDGEADSAGSREK